MHTLQIQAKPRSGHGPPETADQVVIAPTPAQYVAEGRVVDLDDGAGVVAEVAQQAQVELHPACHPALHEQVVGLLEPLRRALDGGSAELSGLVEYLRSSAQPR